MYAELLKTKTVREVMSIMKGYVGEKKLKEVSEDIYYSIGMNTSKNDRMEELMERIENEGLPVAEI